MGVSFVYPILGMAQIAKEAKEDGNLPLAGKMYTELAQYVAPKLKAIELSSFEESVDVTIRMSAI